MSKSNYEHFMENFEGEKSFRCFRERGEKTSPMNLEKPNPYKLTKLNKAGYAIFMLVNETDGKGQKDKNIKRVRAVFADFDGVDPDKCGAMDDMPAFLVQSSPGKYHAYWLVDDDFPLRGFKSTQQSIANKYASDPAVCNLSRVMRVPGFMHQKKEPVPTKVVWINHDYKKLSYGECVELWPPKPAKKFSSPKFKTRTDDYIDVGFTVHELLEKYGWKYIGRKLYRRPGNEYGHSGIISDCGGFFWPYTSSTCLTQQNMHDAFEILARYEYNGDKKRCAREVLK